MKRLIERLKRGGKPLLLGTAGAVLVLVASFCILDQVREQEEDGTVNGLNRTAAFLYAGVAYGEAQSRAGYREDPASDEQMKALIESEAYQQFKANIGHFDKSRSEHFSALERSVLDGSDTDHKAALELLTAMQYLFASEVYKYSQTGSFLMVPVVTLQEPVFAGLLVLLAIGLLMLGYGIGIRRTAAAVAD